MFLDKELQQVARGSARGRGIVDKLVQVWLRSGEDALVLVHIEVQSQEEGGFAERMFVYFARLYNRSRRLVVSAIVLGDESPSWRPAHYITHQALAWLPWRCRGMNIAHASWISPEEYLAIERRSEAKHEYLDGAVWAMAGASDRHVIITTNLVAALRPLLRGGPCRLYSTDMQVYPTAEAYFYPDVMICCDARDRQNRLAKYYPALIVEVISPGTERVDRGKKARAYRRNETLAEYVFVATDRPWVEVYRRESGFWVIHESGPEDAVTLTSINAALACATIYEDVDWSIPYEDEDQSTEGG